MTTTREEAVAIMSRMADLVVDPLFRSQSKLSALLDYIVQQELAGRGDEIDAYCLAREVFGKGAKFNPTKSSLVRVQMFRLRRLLDEYNRKNDVWPQITIPPRCYRPQFHFKDDRDRAPDQR